MDVRRSKTLKVVLVCTAVLAVAVIAVYVFSNSPVEKYQGKEVDKVEINSYDPEEVNGSRARGATMASVMVRNCLEDYYDILNNAEMYTKDFQKYKHIDRNFSIMNIPNTKDCHKSDCGNDTMLNVSKVIESCIIDQNTLIVYKIPKFKTVWEKINYKMPEDKDPLFLPNTIAFTGDAIKKDACVANITKAQGEIVICTGIDKKTALNILRQLARNIECNMNNYECMVVPISEALQGDKDVTIVMYLGTEGNILKIYEPKNQVLDIWYQGVVNSYGLE